MLADYSTTRAAPTGISDDLHFERCQYVMPAERRVPESLTAPIPLSSIAPSSARSRTFSTGNGPLNLCHTADVPGRRLSATSSGEPDEQLPPALIFHRSYGTFCTKCTFWRWSCA